MGRTWPRSNPTCLILIPSIIIKEQISVTNKYCITIQKVQKIIIAVNTYKFVKIRMEYFTVFIEVNGCQSYGKKPRPVDKNSRET